MLNLLGLRQAVPHAVCAAGDAAKGGAPGKQGKPAAAESDSDDDWDTGKGRGKKGKGKKGKAPPAKPSVGERGCSVWCFCQGQAGCCCCGCGSGAAIKLCIGQQEAGRYLGGVK